MEVVDQPVVRINFELGPDDIAHFRERLSKARKKWSLRNDDKVILGAEALIAKATGSNPPTFVLSRMATLQLMIDMLKDHDWKLEEEDRLHILEALAYFSDPNDMIPDEMPGIGFLDDVIMVDLAAFDLAPEIEAYSDFCANREDLAAKLADAQPIPDAREALQARMRRRRRRRAGGSGDVEMITSLFHAGG